MQACVAQGFPEEVCGFFAGKTETNSQFVQAVIPVENILHSKTNFRMSPEKQIEAIQRIEENQMELLGYYHSHPTGNAQLSETDLLEYYDHELTALIWALQRKTWVCKPFRYHANRIIEIQLIIGSLG